MAYTKQNFTDGQILMAAHLNTMETGIKNLSDLVDGLTLGIASDGLIYLFVDGSPVGTGIPQSTGTTADVYGYIDENNVITVTGLSEDSTYTFNYKKEDGSTVEIGVLELDNNTYYSIANSLTNCTNSNSATQVVAGGSYSATITAKDGYTLSSVVVTMGGSAVSVTDGVISIDSVTGNIVITAVAEVAAAAYTNLIPLSTDASGNPYNDGQGWKTGYRISASSGGESATDGIECTGFMPVTYNDTLYFSGINFDNDSYGNYALYNSSKTYLAGGNWIREWGSVVDGTTVSVAVADLNNTQGTITEDVAYIRISANVIDENSVCTVNEEIV